MNLTTGRQLGVAEPDCHATRPSPPLPSPGTFLSSHVLIVNSSPRKTVVTPINSPRPRRPSSLAHFITGIRLRPAARSPAGPRRLLTKGRPPAAGPPVATSTSNEADTHLIDCPARTSPRASAQPSTDIAISTETLPTKQPRTWHGSRTSPD
jgi:hypothetical protein